jgi:hypothetical protein
MESMRLCRVLDGSVFPVGLGAAGVEIDDDSTIIDNPGRNEKKERGRIYALADESVPIFVFI